MILSVKGDLVLFTYFYSTDVRNPLYDHIDNRCHADAPLSSKTRLRVFRRVRQTSPSYSLLSAADIVLGYKRTHKLVVSYSRRPS
jgi:hypothetical protein